MKSYIFDRVSVGDEWHTKIIERLESEGWTNLEYVEHDSTGDKRSPEIVGNRPMTPEEIKVRDKDAAKLRKKEIRELHNLAKALGYTVTKNKE